MRNLFMLVLLCFSLLVFQAVDSPARAGHNDASVVDLGFESDSLLVINNSHEALALPTGRLGAPEQSMVRSDEWTPAGHIMRSPVRRGGAAKSSWGNWPSVTAVARSGPTANLWPRL